MTKHILLLLILVPAYLQANYTIKGTLTNGDNFSWILLYKIKDGKQIYLDNAEVNNGAFEFTIPESESPGIYKVFYKLEDQLYVEFIFNKENVEFTFDPFDPSSSIVFLESDENSINQKYINAITKKQRELDSIQVAYFNGKTSKELKSISKSYKGKLADVNNIQLEYEKRSEGKLANTFIKASKQYNAKNPINAPEDYLSQVKKHFFDAINFDDPNLFNSTYSMDKIMDFIFYLNQSDDLNELNQMQKESIDISLSKIDLNLGFKKNVEEMILDQYASEQNEEMVNYMLNNHYDKLPSALQDVGFIKHVLSEIKTAVGKKSPNITWKENGADESLYNLDGADYYIIVFYSSGCPHCLVEIPEFYDFVKDISNIKVIAIGLEDEETAWVEMSSQFDKFINILDLKKWESQRVEDFGITNIPNYFVLDKEKIIIAKPEDIEELKKYFP